MADRFARTADRIAAKQDANADLLAGRVRAEYLAAIATLRA